jgi:CrcB protein
MSDPLPLIAAVAVAGALGALARDLLDRAVMARLPHARLPLGVLAVNVSGSFLLGLLAGLPGMGGSALYVVAGSGFLGAFTTFSTLTVQTVRLDRPEAVRNVIAQLAGCVAAVLLGLAVAGVVG